MSDTEKANYHHGDLRAALLSAAEAELAQAGPHGFSLRACARRAGVSHAAPKHHFGSVDGLLDALAAMGFRRLTAAMTHAMARAVPERRLIASGAGYVAFARENPSLFKLMFSARRVGPPGPELAEAGAEAFAVLRRAASQAAPGRPEREAALDIAAAWSIVHGLAHLVIEAPPAMRALLGEDAREAAIADVLERPLPIGRGG